MFQKEPAAASSSSSVKKEPKQEAKLELEEAKLARAAAAFVEGLAEYERAHHDAHVLGHAVHESEERLGAAVSAERSLN